jgi:DNA-binding NarL/FixJ family response regulator
MIRVFLVDDHTVLRSGIHTMLDAQPGITVVGEAGDGQELLAQLPHTPADVVLLDINMPGMGGFETLQHLRQDYPDLSVLVLSMLENDHYVTQMLDAGAAGYVLKSAGLREIVYGIEQVAVGGMYVSTEIGLNALRKLHCLAPMGEEAETLAAPLSKRELEILVLIAEGLTNAEMADKLFTSKRTIETHRQNIIEKTKVKNTAALIRFAMNKGLIPMAPLPSPA